MILAVYRGRSWARLVFTVMVLLSIPGVALLSRQGLPGSVLAVSALQALLNLSAAALLTTPTCSNWFQAVKAPRAPLGARAG